MWSRFQDTPLPHVGKSGRPEGNRENGGISGGNSPDSSRVWRYVNHSAQRGGLCLPKHMACWSGSMTRPPISPPIFRRTVLFLSFRPTGKHAYRNLTCPMVKPFDPAAWNTWRARAMNRNRVPGAILSDQWNKLAKSTLRLWNEAASTGRYYVPEQQFPRHLLRRN